MTAFEDYINRELPRRPVFLNAEITGYSGDPNDGAAPAIVASAPVGTFYIDGVAGLWRRSETGADTWIRVSDDVSYYFPTTISDLTLTVDYNDPTAVDPPGNLLFSSQDLVDDYLASEGATAFKHMTALWEALPPVIGNVVTIAVTKGVHRPRATDTTAVWNLVGKLFVGPGVVTLNGSDPTEWDVYLGLSGLVVQSWVEGNDTRLVFPGTPFAGLELAGNFVHLSNGETFAIHDNNDTTLYICDYFDTNPVNGVTTASVHHTPGTIVRNSLTDLAGSGIAGYVLHAEGNCEFHNLALDYFGKSTGRALKTTGTPATLTSNNILVDFLAYKEVTGVGTKIGQSGVTARDSVGGKIYHCFIMRGDRKPAGTGSLYHIPLEVYDAQLQIQGGYLQGSDGSVQNNGGNLLFRNCVLDEWGDSVSGSTSSKGLILTQGDNAKLTFFGWSGYGKRNELRNWKLPAAGYASGVACIHIDNGTVMIGSGIAQPLIFKNCENDCIRLGSGAIMTLVDLYDGGGNGGVGIRVDGPDAKLSLSVATNVTGALGDIRLPDGTIQTWAWLKANSPVVHLGSFSTMSKA